MLEFSEPNNFGGTIRQVIYDPVLDWVVPEKAPTRFHNFAIVYYLITPYIAC
ncbi:hypothetical protein PSEUDO8Z_10490 [Pseudomonas sp. 8Z]|nr:hypothetical protein PSEUDO8Z_10490 [Pseudomonas sp. 8Z]